MRHGVIYASIGVLFAVTAGARPSFGQSDQAVPVYLRTGPQPWLPYLGVASTLQPNGALVTIVGSGTPAFNAGIRKGDLITAVDGLPIGVIDGTPFSLASEIRRAGKSVQLTLLPRNTGTVVNRLVRVGGRGGNRGPTPSPERIPRRLGITSVIEGAGERVRDVPQNSPGALAGLKPGDLVLAVDNYPVGTFGNNAYSVASELRHVGWRAHLTVLSSFTDGAQTTDIEVTFEQPPPIQHVVHPILVGLTDPASTIRSAAENNLRSVRGLLSAIPRDHLAAPIELTGANCNASIILQKLDTLAVNPEDTIFCYVATHGSFNPLAANADDTSGGHQLVMDASDPNKTLMRYELVRALKRKRARLTVLVTDACNQIYDFAPPELTAGPLPGEPLIVTLLFRYKGFVDFNSVAKDRTAWYQFIKNAHAADGGLFTHAFIDSFGAGYQSSWSGMLMSAREHAQSMFLTLKKHYTINTAGTVLSDADGQTLNNQTDGSGCELCC
jgi:hypothetical protein